MSIYVTTDSGDIIESVKTPVGQLPMQKVFKNGKLVSEIFQYGRSHFSGIENIGIFSGRSLEDNFMILRQMCSLGDPTTEHVSSLISEFSVTDEDGTVHTVPVGEGKYKSALFLYWLSEGQSKFTMEDTDRTFVWDYFGDEICRDALENPQTKHTTVKYLLHTYHGGSRVTITRPGDPKKGADSIFAIPDWEEHAHQFRNRAFGYISKSVLFVRGSDNKIYLTRPYGRLTKDQKDAYDDYVHQNGSTQIIPDGMDIQEIIMDDSSIIGLSAKV